MEYNSKVFAEGKTFIVFIDCIIDNKLASFVLHTEGNPRVILKLYLENKHKLHSDIYYMLKNDSIFKNHSELVYEESGEKIYKYIGDK